jgi:hypothetical protein
MKKVMLFLSLGCIVLFFAGSIPSEDTSGDRTPSFVPEGMVEGIVSGYFGDDPQGPVNFKFASATNTVWNDDYTRWTTALRVTSGSARKLIIAFSTEVNLRDYVPEKRLGQFRCLVDGKDLGLDPFTHSYNPTSNRFHTFSFNWWEIGLTKTYHNVEIQFKPDSYVTMYLRDRTLMVVGL